MRKSVNARTYTRKGGWCGINVLRNSGVEGTNRRNLCTQKRSKGRERERENRDAVKGKVWMDETNGVGIVHQVG